MDSIDVSLDIETYSLDIPNAAVISIAACTHDAGFEVYLERKEQLELGRHFDPETLEWHQEIHPMWLKQALRRTAPGVGLYAHGGLERLHWWVSNTVRTNEPADEPIHVWMKTPRFDAGILEHLAKQADTELPWTFRDECDLRTLTILARSRNSDEYALLPKKPDNAHDALVDAKYQLEIISRCKTILNC